MPRITKIKRNYNRPHNSDSRKERQKIYQSKRWQQLRRLKLSENPLCEVCQDNGAITPAVDVHHRVSFMSQHDKAERNRLAFDIDNLQSLCRACHQYQHNQVDAIDTPWGSKIIDGVI